MSIGIVTDDDFLDELSRYNGQTRTPPSEPSIQIIQPEHGRNKGDMNVPESLRKIIGESSVIDGPIEAIKLANQFGISRSSVSAYAKGATSTTTYNEPKPAILEHINKSRRRYIKRASHVMNAAMKSISQEKLDYTDAKDLATIAKDMSVIIKNLEPPAAQVSEDGTRTPQFVIYAPQFKSEQSFEVITVNE